MCQNRRRNDYDSNSPPQFDSWSQSLDRQSTNLQVSSTSSTSLSYTPLDINVQSNSASFTEFQHSKQNLTATALATSSTSNVETTFFDHQFAPTFDLTGVGSSVNEEGFSFISQLEHPTSGEVPVPSDPSPELEMIWSNWPPNLPPPDLLRHLCVSNSIFFSYITSS